MRAHKISTQLWCTLTQDPGPASHTVWGCCGVRGCSEQHRPVCLTHSLSHHVPCELSSVPLRALCSAAGSAGPLPCHGLIYPSVHSPRRSLPRLLCCYCLVCLFVLFSGLLLVWGFFPRQVFLHLYLDFDPLFLKSSNRIRGFRTSVAPESETEF